MMPLGNPIILLLMVLLKNHRIKQEKITDLKISWHKASNTSFVKEALSRAMHNRV
jgi:hypothetical protein